MKLIISNGDRGDLKTKDIQWEHLGTKQIFDKDVSIEIQKVEPSKILVLELKMTMPVNAEALQTGDIKINLCLADLASREL
jgi:hypothetical protein